MVLQLQFVERSLDGPVPIVENTEALDPPTSVQDLDNPDNVQETI
jgi:hypothetical protein